MALKKPTMVCNHELSEYEKIRAQNIKEIQEAMEATLGEISTLKKDVIQPDKSTKKKDVTKSVKNSKVATKESDSCSSRVLRPRKPVSYQDLLEPTSYKTHGFKRSFGMIVLCYT